MSDEKLHIELEAAYQMRRVSRRAGEMVCLPKRRFMTALGATFEFQERPHLEMYLPEIQKQLANYYPELVIGYDPNTEKVCWYSVPEGGKPHTRVPFVIDYVPSEKKIPDPAEVEKHQREQAMIVSRAEAIRIRRGVPVTRQPWYVSEGQTEYERLRPFIPEARKELRREGVISGGTDEETED